MLFFYICFFTPIRKCHRMHYIQARIELTLINDYCKTPHWQFKISNAGILSRNVPVLVNYITHHCKNFIAHIMMKYTYCVFICSSILHYKNFSEAISEQYFLCINMYVNFYNNDVVVPRSSSD